MKYETVDITKAGMDILSVFTMLGTLLQMLPSIAALITIIWTGIRIYETDTVQKLLKRTKGDAQ